MPHHLSELTNTRCPFPSNVPMEPLGAVVSICSKMLSLPKLIRDSCSESNKRQQHLMIQVLIPGIQSALETFGEVYMVLDGIDELPPPEKDGLLDVFQKR